MKISIISPLLEACNVTSWNDQEIIADCTSCGDEVQVESIFGATSAPVGMSVLSTKCAECHTVENSRSVSCTNPQWLIHLQRDLEQSIYDLAEKTYLGQLCREQIITDLDKTRKK